MVIYIYIYFVGIVCRSSISPSLITRLTIPGLVQFPALEKHVSLKLKHKSGTESLGSIHYTPDQWKQFLSEVLMQVI